NRDRLSQELQDTFREVMEGFFRHERYSGITYLRSFLQQLIDDMEKILNAQKKDALDAFKQEMIHSRDAVEECQRDFFLGVTLNKQRAVKRYVGEFVDNANLYYAKKADDAAREEALKIYKQFIHVLKRYQQRVDNQQCGVLTRLQTIRRSLENHYEAKVDVAVNLTATDGWVRTVNGWELFTKGETIINEYKESIDALITSESFQGSRDQMEDELARRVMNDIYTQEIKSHLLVPAQQTSRFDEHSVHVEKSELDDAEIDDIIDFARNLMHNSISQKSVVDRLMQHPQGPSLLQSLLGNNSDSDYFLDWNPGGLAKSDIHKKYKALFFNQSSTDVNAFKQWARRHGISLPPDKDMEDSNQIVLMREMGAFSMGTIRPLQEHGHNTWERFYNREEHQSRGDLRDWLSWKAKDEESLEAIQALFLLGIAIGLIESPQAKQYVVKLQKTRPSDPDEVKLSNDLEEVARKLKRAEAYIAKQIRDWWSEKESPEAFIDAYEKFVNNCDKMFLRGKQELPQRDIEILTTKYIFNHRALEEAYTERYGNLGKFALDKRDERYWCPECHKDLGPNINSLFAYNPATGIRERKCPYCSKVFD
ncbi:MAG TPA: hypothetical protein GX745_07870, partial [Clostridiales bacterium]|nr:hypothetical protein [Clostridiales bacterium]